METKQSKIALVTGGGRDIGREVSIKLALSGYKICIVYHNDEESAVETVNTIKNSGGDAFCIRGNMTIQKDVVKTIEACIAEYGPQIDTLVNVAGGLLARKVLADMVEDFWDQVIDLNLKSVFLVSKAAVPYMNAGSTIVNFSSQAARDGGGFGALAYATAKGGVLTFTRGLAKELGPKGIRVNCVSPGMINTSFHDTFTKPEVRKNVAAAAPLRREGKAEEIADLVLYLAGESSSYITGESIEINGGTYFA